MDINYNKEVGKRLFQSRKAAGMTRAYLGTLINLHESTIKRYEDGEIKSLDISKIAEFAKALHVTPAYLMGWEENNSNIVSSPLKDQGDKITLGEKLKKLRKEQKKTQQEISDLIGVEKSTYLLYESGKCEPTVLILKKLAQTFNTTVDYLLSSELENVERGIIIEDKSGKEIDFIIETTPKESADKRFRRLYEIFQRLDENNKKELLSYAEFKEQAYKDDPDLKDAENIAHEYIKECDEEDKSDESEKNTPDQPEKIG